MKHLSTLILGKIYRFYYFSNIPFRRRLDPLIRIANCIKASLFPRKDYTIEEFRVAVTNICNAACCFCTYPQAVMKSKVMSLETFLNAIPYFSHLFPVDLTPAIGDPLVDPKLEQKVMALSEKGFKCQFTTNGILLERHMSWIFRRHEDISVILLSIPGFDPSQYAVQYGVDKGQQVCAAIYSLLETNERLGQPLRILVQIRNREHKKYTLRSEEYKWFKPFIHGRVTLHFTEIWDNWSGAVDMSTWSKHMLKRIRWSPQIGRPCRNLRFGLVNPDGGLRLCGCRVIGTDQDDMIIGKVGDTKEQLHAKALEIRNGFYKGRFPFVCRNCSFYNPE